MYLHLITVNALSQPKLKLAQYALTIASLACTAQPFVCMYMSASLETSSVFVFHVELLSSMCFLWSVFFLVWLPIT